MIEKIEINEALKSKMNSFPAATDATHVYAEGAGGAQVRVAKSDLANMVNSFLNSKIDIITDTNKDMDTIKWNARSIINNSYTTVTGKVNPLNNWGLLETKIYASGHILQVITSWFNPETTLTRAFFSGSWTTWR
mgnify:CR=1 FL=1